MSQRYLLDTNVVSHIMQGRDAELLARLTKLSVGQVVMSSVTLAELEYGLHRKGQPVRLKNALTQVLLRMDVLPWDEQVATCYGEFCSTLEAQGINFSDFDMMIAAHAVAVNATLVSRDRAFAQVHEQRFRLEIW
ncbi:MAG: type II toxin-antitoxin system VapC family toxin [Gammaproteobacteria bacterium]|uniref:type II toxin-antitoxin system VapC family toxin n=1 Tax=Rhodoferax sp. TaxID=50421 RepID=UPI0017A70329|nr:type II toxin-antitoxin system VapC family toxin [Rhodoferax sp.]MBU3900495.1 type II toxin-antitoxin system VapC family toxin [Gammaproteobacteria bacterium]MBA3059962.1 type II toxin-antitoxin system VapC family toxin [Rhodoferax sp.]MBU3996400.1 type II toxin-antitoxin system VapC family toxin [Gammaproteobacteria bacterium]MBU4079940.1 type II toxin-antitoxin system VapC family toxin [Gammaproteobacteria bacterium]MBU4112955.1 type II toxin-antitoxin system VapC family toxin [Gammaprote